MAAEDPRRSADHGGQVDETRVDEGERALERVHREGQPSSDDQIPRDRPAQRAPDADLGMSNAGAEDR